MKTSVGSTDTSDTSEHFAQIGESVSRISKHTDPGSVSYFYFLFFGSSGLSININCSWMRPQ